LQGAGEHRWGRPPTTAMPTESFFSRSERCEQEPRATGLLWGSRRSGAGPQRLGVECLITVVAQTNASPDCRADHGCLSGCRRALRGRQSRPKTLAIVLLPAPRKRISSAP